MPFDRTLSQDALEPRALPKTPTAVASDSSHEEDICRAAASPAHGCCCSDDQVEEYERWDGLA